MQIDNAGRVTSGREILKVDRAADANLRQHLDFANSVKNMPEVQRAQALARYIDGVMSPPSGRANVMDHYHQITPGVRNAEVLIGDVKDWGVCRHRSLLFQVMAEEAGLNPSIVRGNAGHPGQAMGGHAWNELRLSNGDHVLVDIMNPRPGFEFPKLNEATDWYRRMDGAPYYGY